MKKISDINRNKTNETASDKKIPIRFLLAALIWTIVTTLHLFLKSEIVCVMVWMCGLLFIGFSYIRHQRILSEKQQAKKELSESEQKYRQIFLNLFDCVVITSPSGEIIDFNTAFLKLFGYESREKAAQSSAYQLYANPEERPQVIHLIEQNGYISEHPIHMKRQDGYVMDALLTSVLIKNEDNAVKYYVSIMRDITERKRLESEIRESEKKFRLAFETAQDAILWANAETGILIECNESATLLFERPKIEIIGADQTILHPPGKAEYYKKLFEEQLNWARSGIEAEIITKSEKIKTVTINVSLTEVAGQKVIQGIFRDITERKQMEKALRESEERFRLFMDNIPVLAWMKDEQGRYVYANKTLEKRFGLSAKELLGKTDIDLWKPDFAKRYSDKDREVLSTGKLIEFPEETENFDGSRCSWLTYKFLFIDTSKQKFVGGIGADITERVRSEELRIANAALEKAAHLKDQFLAAMSHELRTPLTGVLTLSEALLEEVYGSLNEKQLKSIRTIESSGQHLLDLINDILDLSKIEAGQMELQIEKSSVSDICQSALQLIKGMADKKHHKISLDMNPVSINMNADPRRLKQMLMNLLSNAVKFTPEGGQIGLDVRQDDAGQMILFTVTDTGIGIAPEKLPMLFKPFVQLDSSLSRKYSGTGLGLSLVKRMAELHGGSVSFESELGKGSRFTISLPWGLSEPRAS
jgi:PAS domain S-box-containing protein